MPWYDIFWTDQAVDHLAAHGVSQEDFEWVASGPDSDDWSRSRPDRRIAWGYTEDGRYIACVYEPLDDRVTIIPVTAYETQEPGC